MGYCFQILWPSHIIWTLICNTLTVRNFRPFSFQLKVSKFQNKFMKASFRLSFLPKYEPNIVRISALYCVTLQGRNPYNSCSNFGRNDYSINSFWNLLTFTFFYCASNAFIYRKLQVTAYNSFVLLNSIIELLLEELFCVFTIKYTYCECFIKNCNIYQKIQKRF